MKTGMTRREMEITEPERIVHILDTCKVLHLGLSDNNRPYVVPMNYGYTLTDGRLTLYLHSGTRGYKLDVLEANPQVFATMECELVPFAGDAPCSYGLAYQSLMAEGTASIITDSEERKAAMSILMKVQTGMDFSYTDRLLSVVTMIRIDCSRYTAKERPIPARLAMEKKAAE